MNRFREMIYDGKDHGVTFRGGKSSNKVHGDVGPGSMGHRQGSQ